MSNQEKTKEEFAIDYIKSLAAVEEEMLPYMEHRKNFVRAILRTAG